VKKLITAVIVIILALVGYQQYHKYQQVEQQQRALQAYQQEKQALDTARATNTPGAIEQFMVQYPDSAWIGTAQYYLEKQLLDKAIEAGEEQALQKFINAYPNSVWKQHAVQQRKIMQSDREIREAEQRLKEQRAVEADRQALLQNQAKAPEPVLQPRAAPAIDSLGKPVKRASNEARERVNRALSIYSKLDKERVKREEEKRKRQQQEEDIRQKCNRLKDQLKQFRHSDRRWYKLDEQGKRIFMRPSEVDREKAAINKQIEEYCQ
jgi:hypothetical protein